MADNPFSTNIFDQTVEVQKYEHGYTPQEVEDILAKKAALEKRINNNGEPVSLEEFQSIVIPALRINRTTSFNLNPEKPKKAPKEPKEPKPKKEKSPSSKEPKEKKLTKKQIQEKISSIIMAMAMGKEISEEDKAFFEEQAGGKI